MNTSPMNHSRSIKSPFFFFEVVCAMQKLSLLLFLERLSQIDFEM